MTDGGIQVTAIGDDRKELLDTAATLRVLVVSNADWRGDDEGDRIIVGRLPRVEVVVERADTMLMALGRLSAARFDALVAPVRGQEDMLAATARAARRLAPAMRLMLAARPEEEPEAMRAMNSGFDDYCIEPVIPADVIRCLRAPARTRSFDPDLTTTTRQADQRKEVEGRRADASSKAIAKPQPTGEPNPVTSRATAKPSPVAPLDSPPPRTIPHDRAQPACPTTNTVPESPKLALTAPTTTPPSSPAITAPESPPPIPPAPLAPTRPMAFDPLLLATTPITGLSSEPIADAEMGDVDLIQAMLRDRAGARALAVRIAAARSGIGNLALTQEQTAPTGHVAIPLRLGGESIGWLHAPPPATAAAIDPWAQWLLHWLALAEQYDRLWQAALRDNLTGVWNRRYFEAFLEHVIRRAGQERFRVTLLLFDIDDFKRYNDQYGHAAGDEILREAGRLMRSVVRTHDVVARIGGDEFAVIFWDAEEPRRPNSQHPDNPVKAAKRFQRAICEHRFPKLLADAPGTLTISGGLAGFPWDERTAAGLIELADQRLLQSKRQGKNALTFGPGAAETCEST